MTYIMFAKWFGIVSLILSLGILFNLDDAKIMAKNFVHSESGYIMGGVLPIIFGTFTLMHQHDLTLGWNLVVTAMGIFMLVIGIFRVFFVHTWRRIIESNIDKVPSLFSFFGLMLGLLLIYVGFIAHLL